ncbi:MAG: 2-succinyl-5-enolpyruvyl-6-hydroxy-3-cyclohexene-1-carboxylic-acid synthase [Flavobacteriales bacterium]|nr:2-succinyl-5-enolpyruvyl-6-hydroxy-3-cyclohexene-1-carboxylic-acid synthase [Flavobacteriales bacterium]MCB9197038.1 2-succinyl-5-enolpyruvyl-6-hydroxy-3-cyclohexene-1-carboxylic-acid synthase [Flavobacteriales bacterium]
MISNIKSVQFLKKFAEDFELFDWFFSPGSRNAPIVATIANDRQFNSTSIVDERSAGFIALGNSIRSKKASVICCTSGSASLNYAPAISEAFYQEIPMLIVTADRPQKWIDNGEGQSIHQIEVYKNYCLRSFHIDEDSDDDIIESIFVSIAAELQSSRKGPIHLNLAFEEPLYNFNESLELPNIRYQRIEEYGSIRESDYLEKWKSKERIIVLIGQHSKSEGLTQLLKELMLDKRVVVMTENLSNTTDFHFVNCIDRTLPSINLNRFHPDLVITFGGAIVSKKIKNYFRAIANLEHWHISNTGTFPDVFQCLTFKIERETNGFLRNLIENNQFNEVSEFQNFWIERSLVNKENHSRFLQKIPWSDLKVHALIHDLIPDGSVLHQGNSSVVRYYQLFDTISEIEYLGNRGVSGIDGSMSTAVGYACRDNRLNVLVIGDLSFVYDNNALWNNLDKSNLLIIVINNEGGGIFRIIPGPDKTGKLDDFFEVGNSTDFSALAKAHNLDYQLSINENDLEENIINFLDLMSKKKYKGAIIEVRTPNILSSEILKSYFISVNT